MDCEHNYIRVSKSSWRGAPYDLCSRCGAVREVATTHQGDKR